MVAPIPAVAVNRSRSPRTSGRLAPARITPIVSKHDQLRVPLHFLRHLLKRCFSDETSESFDLLRHLSFSLGKCEASFRARGPARMSASMLCSQLLRRAALVHGRREGKRVYYRLAAEDAVLSPLPHPLSR